MKHKRLKNYLLNGTLLFGIVLLTYSCQKDKDILNEPQGDIRIERISLNDFNNSVTHNEAYNRINRSQV